MEGRISVIEQIESSTVDFLRNSDPHGYGVHWDTIYVQMRLQNYLKDKKLSRKIFYTYLTKFKLNGFLVNGIQRGTYAAFDCADPGAFLSLFLPLWAPFTYTYTQTHMTIFNFNFQI